MFSPTPPSPPEHDRQSWLSSLERDSWQLELVISGVVIFLLLAAYSPLLGLERSVLIAANSEYSVSYALAVLYYTTRAVYFGVLLVFIGHLLLRGLWIAAIGLRSVSGNYDFEALALRAPYDNWLRGRLGSFDDYISRLEARSSVAFSFGFLVLFLLMSVGIAVVATDLAQEVAARMIGWGFAAFLKYVFIVLGAIYVVDFITLGWIKRIPVLGKVWWPVYRVIGWLILAGLYRPFYYNLIDHPYGRRPVQLLPAIVFLALVLSALQPFHSPYYPVDSSTKTVEAALYDDSRAPYALEYFNFPSLSSRFAGEKGYLELFVPYLAGRHDRVLGDNFPELEPARKTGWKLGFPFYLGSHRNPAANPDTLLAAYGTLVEVRIDDSLVTEPSWRFYDHPERGQLGFLYTIPVYELPRGEHRIVIREQIISLGKPLWREDPAIYFYH